MPVRLAVLAGSTLRRGAARGSTNEGGGAERRAAIGATE